MLKRFNTRLESIIGSQRIPRAEKPAKADEATRAADELLSEIETGLSVHSETIDTPAKGRWPGSQI